MTKEEKQKTFDTLEKWVERCESFYEHFEDVFKERADAILELQARIDSTSGLDEYLFCCGFITVEKYLEVADRLDVVWKKLRKLFEIKQKEKTRFYTVKNNNKSCFDCMYKRSLIASKQDWCLCTGRRINELVGCGLWQKTNSKNS